jgi:ABC-2 type transport system permease protein
MKKMFTVLKFELGNYFAGKTFIISTILICVVCVFVMFFPRIKEGITGGSDDDSTYWSEDDTDGEDDELEKLAVYDPTGIISLADDSAFKAIFPDSELYVCESPDEVKSMVEDETAAAGFVINKLENVAGMPITPVRSFDYYIYNKGMFDTYSEQFSEYLAMLAKYEYCENNNLDVEEFFALEYTPVTANEIVLGKDSTENYWYCYALVIIIFMLIIIYGTTIATGVANEKGNRSIEILVTSTSSNVLLFGKVFAGVIASVIQVALIGVSLLGSYSLNRDYWGGSLSMLLDIPLNVGITFAVFGIGGFLVYAFMYGALGALVSKVEDLNKSSGTAQMIVTLVYVLVLCKLTDVDGVLIKVLSFLPISSYSAMFARVAMGHVALWEVVLSAVILYASVVGMGFLGGKIFRSSTLRYGNPIKLTTAFKNLKSDKN